MSSCNMACIELLRFLVWRLAKIDEVEVFGRTGQMRSTRLEIETQEGQNATLLPMWGALIP